MLRSLTTRFKYIAPTILTTFAGFFDNKYKTESKIDYGKYCDAETKTPVLIQPVESKKLQPTPDELRKMQPNDLKKLQQCFFIQSIGKMTTYDDFYKIVDILSNNKELQTEETKLLIINFFKNRESIIKTNKPDLVNSDFPNIYFIDNIKKLIKIYPSIKIHACEHVEVILNHITSMDKHSIKYINDPLFQEYIYNICVTHININIKNLDIINNKKIYYCRFLTDENLKKIFDKYIDDLTFSEMLAILDAKRDLNFILYLSSNKKPLNLDKYLMYYLKKQTDKNKFIGANSSFMTFDFIVDNITDPNILFNIIIYCTSANNYVVKYLNGCVEKYFYDSITLLGCEIHINELIDYCDPKIKRLHCNPHMDVYYHALENKRRVIIYWCLLKKNRLDLLAGILNKHVPNKIIAFKIYEYIYLNCSFEDFALFVSNTENINKQYKKIFNELKYINARFIKDKKQKDDFLLTLTLT